MSRIPRQKQYDLIRESEMHLKFYAQEFILMPSAWQGYSDSTSLTWESVKFEAPNSKDVPENEGVYTFVIHPGIGNHPACAYLCYVGKTESQNLRKRFKQYFQEEYDEGGRARVQKMLGKWEGFVWFYFALVSDISTIDSLENALITAYKPPINDRYEASIERKARKAAWP